MDFRQLQKLGGFVSRETVKKSIEFTRPRLPDEGEGEPVKESGDIFIRKRSSRDFLDIARASDSDKAFLALHRCVCNEDGSPFFPSVEEAALLAEWILGPMLVAVNEVNAFTPKPYPPRTSRGTTSRSPSAGEASPNGKTRSARKRGPRG